MSNAWLTVLLMALMTMITRTSGTLIVGNRQLPSWMIPVISVLPAALLTALIVVQIFTKGDQVMVDERLAGLLVAGLVLISRRGAVIPAMFAAAIIVAAIRAFS